jgi:hypothetical protein
LPDGIDNAGAAVGVAAVPDESVGGGRRRQAARVGSAHIPALAEAELGVRWVKVVNKRRLRRRHRGAGDDTGGGRGLMRRDLCDSYAGGLRQDGGQITSSAATLQRFMPTPCHIWSSDQDT